MADGEIQIGDGMVLRHDGSLWIDGKMMTSSIVAESIWKVPEEPPPRPANPHLEDRSGGLLRCSRCGAESYDRNLFEEVSCL